MAVGWYRALVFSGPTGPRVVQWQDAQERALACDRDLFLDDTLVLGERLIVRNPCNARGLAWIDPAHGLAKVAWPADIGMIAGVAVRDRDTFAIVYEAEIRDRAKGPGPLMLGIAARDKWARPPIKISEPAEIRDGERSESALVLAAAWHDGAAEVVITVPTAEDRFGQSSAPNLVRFGLDGERQIRTFPTACAKKGRHHVAGAVLGREAWNLVVDTYKSHEGARLVDSTCEPVAGSTLQWEPTGRPDRTALGTLFWNGLARGEERVNAQGLPWPTPTLVTGWVPSHLSHLAWTEEEGLRSLHPWVPSQDRFDLYAHEIGKRVLYTMRPRDYSGPKAPLLMGTSPETLKVAVLSSSVGTFLARPGGYYWVTGNGEFVTLDDALHRVDSLPLLAHLREHTTSLLIPTTWSLYWILFGLPIAFVLAALGARFSPTPGAEGALGPSQPRGLGRLRVLPALPALLTLYILFGIWALNKLLPLL
jgi:hypothetical protein